MSIRGHGALEESRARSHGVFVESGRVRITDVLEQAETVSSGEALVLGPATEELPPDVQVGRFTLLRLLGRGGMGIVYTAYDELLDRVVAIKMVRGDRHDVHLLGRVLREAKALAKLSHPNVVQIYDVGESDGQVFIAMEYVQGPTLRAWSEARRREGARARELLDMYIQAGRGLAAAHAAGLVHRDFKPESGLMSQVPKNTRVSRLRRGYVPILYQAEGPVKRSTHQYRRRRQDHVGRPPSVQLYGWPGFLL